MGCGGSTPPPPDAAAPDNAPKQLVPALAPAPTRAPAPAQTSAPAPSSALADGQESESLHPEDLPAQTTKPRRRRRHSRENQEVAELMHAYHETDAIGRAKELFEESDEGSTGRVSKSALVAKLRADKQLDALLDMQDKDGVGMLCIMRMLTVLKKLEADGDGSIAWAEFQAAVAEANPDEVVAPALSARAKALFEAAVVEEANSGDASSVHHRVKQAGRLPLHVARQMGLGYVGPLPAARGALARRGLQAVAHKKVPALRRFCTRR